MKPALISWALSGGAAVTVGFARFGYALILPAMQDDLALGVPSLAGVWLSAALVGVSVMMVPSAVTGFVKNNLAPAAWGSALAVATSLFAAGQTIGPVAAGWISDVTESLSVGLGLSATILFMGAILAFTQKPLAAR